MKKGIYVLAIVGLLVLAGGAAIAHQDATTSEQSTPDRMQGMENMQGMMQDMADHHEEMQAAGIDCPMMSGSSDRGGMKSVRGMMG